MTRLDAIINHPLYAEELNNIREDEEARIYCKHDMEHYLSVARIMTIISNEEGLSFPKEHIYAAALLHDIGRSRQYRYGISHEEAGADIALKIMPECGFTEDETRLITDAIKAHRGSVSKERTDLGRILFIADKKSRSCYICNAEKTCNWSEEKKNLYIEY